MTYKQIKLINKFIDTYDELVDSHIVEGSLGIENSSEICTVNAALATILIINNLMEETR